MRRRRERSPQNHALVASVAGVILLCGVVSVQTTQASQAYSNTTFALRYGGMFAMLNQIVQHLLSEHVTHGLRACFATKGDWAYAPDPAFERAHGCAGARCYIDRELVCAHRPPRAPKRPATDRHTLRLVYRPPCYNLPDKNPFRQA